MYTCKIVMYTCILNHVYMQDDYVYMQDNYDYIIMYTCIIIMYTWNMIMYICKLYMYTCKIIMYTCKMIVYTSSHFFFTQVKTYVVQWKQYVVISFHGHRRNVLFHLKNLDFQATFVSKILHSHLSEIADLWRLVDSTHKEFPFPKAFLYRYVIMCILYKPSCPHNHIYIYRPCRSGLSNIRS